MATGVLVVGVERATRLLTYLVAPRRSTWRRSAWAWRRSPTTPRATSSPGATPARSATQRVAAGVAALTGTIDQVPSAVSAIKVDGRRAYARVRAGEAVELAARR